MSKNTTSFKHESLQDQASALAYLNLICQGIEKGQIHLANEEDDVTLTTKGLSRLKVKAKQAKSHQELRITLAWSGDLEQTTTPKPEADKADKLKKSKKLKTDKKVKDKSKPKKNATKKAK